MFALFMTSVAVPPGSGEAVRVNISGTTGFGCNHALDVLVHIGMEIEVQCEGKTEKKPSMGRLQCMRTTALLRHTDACPPALQFPFGVLIADLTYNASKDLDVRIWK